jgi:hypothetical protein
LRLWSTGMTVTPRSRFIHRSQPVRAVFAPVDRACHGYTAGTSYVGLEIRREIESPDEVGDDVMSVTLINSCYSQTRCAVVRAASALVGIVR